MSLVSASNLNWFAYLSYLFAHASASLDGTPCESSRGNNGLCSGSDFKIGGAFGAWRAVALILRAVSDMRCRVRRSLKFSAMVVRRKMGTPWEESYPIKSMAPSSIVRQKRRVIHPHPNNRIQTIVVASSQSGVPLAANDSSQPPTLSPR